MTLIRLDSRLEVQATRHFLIPLRARGLVRYCLEPEPEVSARDGTLFYGALVEGGGSHVMTLDAALYPTHRREALIEAFGQGRVLPGWIALLASLALAVVTVQRRLRLRVLDRMNRWEGQLGPDRQTLVAHDGALVQLVVRGGPSASAQPGALCTAVGRRRGVAPGGPFREPPAIVDAEEVFEGAWPEVRRRLRGAWQRWSLAAAAGLWVLSVSAVDIWLG